YVLYFFFFYSSSYPRDLHSFPTRRSSDLWRFIPRRARSLLSGLSTRRPCSMSGRISTPSAGPRPQAPSQPPPQSPKLISCRGTRSEEHTSELQSPYDLVCRLLLEKKKHNN